MWLRILAPTLAWIAEQSAAMAIPYFLERWLRGKGAKGPVTIWSKDLDSGYNVQEDRKQNMAKNSELLDKLIAKYPPKVVDGNVVETYCNFALQEYAKSFGYDGFKGLNANEICEKAEADKAFAKDSAERATEHAKKGGFAFAGKQYTGHGHVAAVYPGPMVYSGSWGKFVPLLGNVGKKNGIMATSLAFPIRLGEPTYYLYGVGQV